MHFDDTHYLNLHVQTNDMINEEKIRINYLALINKK